MNAYLYIRWSSARQGKEGRDSLRRQRSMGEKCAALNNLILEELPIDDGVSAWKGKNLAEGTLGQFIDDVENGKVATPTTLLVEQMDRLSRVDIWAAPDIVRHLVRIGVRVITTKDNKIYDSTNINDIAYVISAIVESDLAAKESKKKSDRLLEVWEGKKQRAMEHGHAITNMVPFWLKRNGTNFEIDNTHIPTIEKIFELYSNGIGTNMIAQYLNEHKFDTPMTARKVKAKRWYGETIRKLLLNKALIGYYNDKSDYYPVVIDPVLFAKVQKVKGVIKEKKGGGNNHDNILARLCTCAVCGDTMYRRLSGKRYEYRCRSGINDKTVCNAAGWLTEDVIEIVIKSIREINIKHLLSNDSNTLIKTLREKITQYNFELEENVKINNRLEKALDFTDDETEIKYIFNRRKELREQAKIIEEQLAISEKELNQVNNYATEYASAKDNIDALYLHDTPENRLKINLELRKIISNIRMDNKKKHLYIEYKNGKVAHFWGNGEIMITAATDAKTADEWFDNIKPEDVTFEQIGDRREVLSTNEVLKLCNISRSTLYRYIHAGTFPQPVKSGVRNVVFYKEDIENWKG